MNKSDLIIIGCGPGGYRTAEYAARNGLTVTVMEKGHAGGTCLNNGCIPTKTLCRNAELIELFKESETFGIHAQHFDIDFAKMMGRKDSVVGRLRGGVEMLMNQPGITYIEGEGRLKNAHTVMACGEEYTAASIIIATGSHAKMPSIEGIHAENVITSTELLNIKSLPERLCIIGAGVIGMEFASIFNAFGSEVTVVEFLKECLPVLDADIAKRLRKSLEKRGVTFQMQSAVTAITNDGVVFTDKKGNAVTVEADEVLMAVGRAPRV